MISNKNFYRDRFNWQEAKLVNLLMQDGKKQKAEKIVKEAIIFIHLHQTKPFAYILSTAIKNSGSIFHLKSRRRAAQRVRIPFPLSKEQQDASGLRRLVREAKHTKGFSMGEKLGYTLLQAANGLGKSVAEQKRERMEVKKNRGNLYLRW